MHKNTNDLDYLAKQLDSRFQGPFGFRFGWDGILGLIPGVGDLVTSSFSFYIILRAAAIGVSPIVLARMGLNVLIDNTLDKIPLLGLVFDFVWKANQKNVALLKQASLNPHRTTWQSRLWVFLVLILILSLFLLTVAVGVYLLWAVINFIASQTQNPPNWI